MSTSTSDGEILAIRQVADFLKVTDRTIYRLAVAKKIPAFKVGDIWRFSPNVFETLDFGMVLWGEAHEYPQEILLCNEAKPAGLFHLRIT